MKSSNDDDQWIDQNYRNMVATNRAETLKRFKNAELDSDDLDRQAWWNKTISLGRLFAGYLLAWVLLLAGIAIWKGWVKF